MINYKAFIQDNFLIKNKEGQIVPFLFNETQDYYYNLLVRDYPEFKGIRENILKFRQPGFSSLIDAIFTVDFIWSEKGELPIIDADIVSHKEKETKVLFDRVDFFLDSFLEKNNIERKDFLSTDTGLQIKGKRGALINVQTGNAKVSGRGGTKQNIHWSEVGFYPNTDILSAEDLVTAAEQQVADGIGKIFRESTGNLAGDFFATEYERGKIGIGEYKSRFLGWWLHKEYKRVTPIEWIIPDEYLPLVEKYKVSREQCYWHFKKMETAKDKYKIRREYPTDDTEAFLMGGSLYFDSLALLHYSKLIKQPIREDYTYV